MKYGTPIILLLAFLALFLLAQATPTALRQADTEDEDQMSETPAPVTSPASSPEDVPPALSPVGEPEDDGEDDEDDEDDEDMPPMASPMVPDSPVAPVTSPAGEPDVPPAMTPVGEPEDDDGDEEETSPMASPVVPDVVPVSPVAPVPGVESTPMVGVVEATPMMEVESTPMVGDGVVPSPVDEIPAETPSFVAGTQPGTDGESCAEAERACVLGFAGTSGLQTFNLAKTTPNVPFTPAVVSKDPSVSIGILNSNIEGEFIGDDGSVTLFSQAMVEGQRLSPSFFKMLTINGRVSGVAHETPQVGQVAAVVGKCVRVFVTEWQVLQGGRVVDNVNGKTNKRDNVCVVFRTIAA